MNATVVGMLVVIGAMSAVALDVPERFRAISSESVAAAQQVITAGDLRSMAVMLDATYLMDRRLPKEEEFADWLAETFKENNAKDLAEDHWGHRYCYTVTKGRRYELRSVGPDGVADTEDDMSISGP